MTRSPFSAVFPSPRRHRIAAAALAAWWAIPPVAGGAPPEGNVPQPEVEAAADDPIAGAWRPRTYRIGGETPAELTVDGRIRFDPGTPGEWFVLFFVVGADGTPQRGSAEGGQWFREGEDLVLTHAWHLSAGDAVDPLPEAPLRMASRSFAEAAEGHREPCRTEVEGDRMTLFFPSGNSMTFLRAGP